MSLCLINYFHISIFTIISTSHLRATSFSYHSDCYSGISVDISDQNDLSGLVHTTLCNKTKLYRTLNSHSQETEICHGNMFTMTKFLTYLSDGLKKLYPFSTNCGRRQWHPTPGLLPGKSHGLEEPGRLQSTGSLRVGHD